MPLPSAAPCGSRCGSASSAHLFSLQVQRSLDSDVSVDDGAMARATDWLRGAEQRHAEGAEAEAPHVELAIEAGESE